MRDEDKIVISEALECEEWAKVGDLTECLLTLYEFLEESELYRDFTEGKISCKQFTYAIIVSIIATVLENFRSKVNEA